MYERDEMMLCWEKRKSKKKKKKHVDSVVIPLAAMR